MISLRSISVLAMLTAFGGATAVPAQETVDATPLAEAFVSIGCSGNEKDMYPFIGQNGLDAKTFAAQFKALGESGHLVSDDHGETFRLTNWGPCE